MSPLMFSLFIDDFELFLHQKHDSGSTLDDITFILLLFADDMVILGDTISDLQNSLNWLHTYCNICDMADVEEKISHDINLISNCQ